MSKIKKCLAVLVCAAMVLAVMPGVALAEEGVTADGLEYEVYDNHVKITGYSGDITKVNIPVEIEGKPITVIDDMAFYHCQNLTEVTIPSSVIEIGDKAFGNCLQLTDINVENNNTSYASQNGILFNKSMTKIIQYPSGKMQESYNISPNVTAIEEEAFYGCDYLISVTIPDSVIKIGNEAFADCDSLIEINVANNNPSYTSQDGVLFNKLMTVLVQYPGGNERESYNISPSVTDIRKGAFLGCNAQSITIPNSVVNIEDFAFLNCRQLKSIIIPDGVININIQAFSFCTNLTDVYYAGSEDDWTNIDIYPGNAILLNANIHFNSTGPSPEIKVTVNGAPIDFDVPPMAIDGTTMLPVRYALEPLGAEFVWDGEARTVTITAKGKTIVLTIGSATALVDGVEKTMAQPAMANDGRTLIPIRFVSEELGYDVQWDSETNTVIING